MHAINRVACALALPIFAWQALAWQPAKPPGIKRLYVEPFTTQAGSEKLREDMLSELRKMSSISLVSSEAAADLILGGGGEIWIKGYRSLNPRSDRLQPAGTPVYAGFLSVELRNAKGETLWSYLATPGANSEDVSKDLAKRIVKHLPEGLEPGEAPSREAPLPQPSTILKGAGATFPYPVYEKWFTNYRRENPNLEIVYDAIGSEAGVRRLLAGDADFGASDSPEAIRDLAPGEDGKYLLIPSVVGAVVPIVNLPGFSGEIAFTSEALAGIYLGKIKKWNDPILRQANRGLRLPDLDIVVVHRADGSGTSYAWTDYLSKTNPEWKAQAGVGFSPRWPAGRPATGNDGVAKLVKELGGSIGYVELTYVLRNHLSFGRVRNRNGEFVEASLESIAVAAGQSLDDTSIVNAPGAGAYPIASLTWFLVPGHFSDGVKRDAITAFLKWMLGPGQLQAAASGYLALPKSLISRAQATIMSIN
jgi:phosphate ABC transporter phosphate-binding protein